MITDGDEKWLVRAMMTRCAQVTTGCRRTYVPVMPAVRGLDRDPSHSSAPDVSIGAEMRNNGGVGGEYSPSPVSSARNARLVTS